MRSFRRPRCEAGIGRAFVREDEQAGGGPGGFKVILTDDLWMRLFNGDKAAIGRTLRIQGHSYTVIGIMPRGFQFPFETPAIEMYVTFAEDAATADGTKPTQNSAAITCFWRLAGLNRA